MTNRVDNFNYPNGALGPPWEILSGSVQIVNNRAVPSANRSICVFQTNNPDGTIQEDIGSPGQGGYALYFRVVDANNWWRLGYNYYAYSYDAGYTEQYDTGQTQQVQTGTETYNDYNVNSTTVHFSNPSGSYNEAQTYTAIAPAQPNWSSNYTASNGQAMHYVYADPMTTTAHYSTRPTYTTQPVYGTREVYGTAYAYKISLERCVGGSVVGLGEVGVGQSTWIRVVIAGNNIKTYTSYGGATPHHNANDANFATATKHGFGYYDYTYYGNSDGIDNFSALMNNRAPGSPGVPSVTPNPVNNIGTVTWSPASDVDVDPVTYTMQISTDGGATWSGDLIPYQSSNVVNYDFTNVAATTNAMVRVIANDGAGGFSGWSMSGVFTVAHNAVARIWNGVAFVVKPLMIWTGTQWKTVTAGKLKRWNGSAWADTI